jgi:hypothetical protein
MTNTKRRMIPETLENTSSEDYSEFRTQMVRELVAFNLDQPQGALLDALEGYLLHDFQNMDDIDLQDHYDGFHDGSI